MHTWADYSKIVSYRRKWKDVKNKQRKIRLLTASLMPRKWWYNMFKVVRKCNWQPVFVCIVKLPQEQISVSIGFMKEN